jgi:DNA-binding transcriptional ArsR family regulator
MALARKNEFETKKNEIAAFAKALSHPARVAILATLAEKQECICGELVLDLPLAQSTVSQHLKALKDIGLIKGTIDGPRSKYCIDWKVFERHQNLMNQWTQRLLKHKKNNAC